MRAQKMNYPQTIIEFRDDFFFGTKFVWHLNKNGAIVCIHAKYTIYEKTGMFVLEEMTREYERHTTEAKKEKWKELDRYKQGEACACNIRGIKSS